MTLKYPSLSVTEEVKIDDSNSEDIFKLITKSVHNVFDREKVYNDFTLDEMEKFVGDLPKDFLEKFLTFFNTMPRVRHKLTYKCEKCGEEVTHNLAGLMDFFL